MEIDNQADGQRHRHLFEHAPICIFVIDARVPPAAIFEVNRRAELVYGYSYAELSAMPATQLMPNEAVPVFWAMMKRVSRGQLVTIETTHRHRDATHFPVRVIAVPDPTDVAHMIVTVEDMTTEQQRWSEVAAIDAERRRIAHEFHDGVAQTWPGYALSWRIGLTWLK